MAARIKEKAQKNLRNEPMACCANSVLYAISALSTLLVKKLFLSKLCVALAVNSAVKKQQTTCRFFC